MRTIQEAQKDQRRKRAKAEEQEKIKEGQRVIKVGDYVEFVYKNLQLWGKVTTIDTITNGGDIFVYIDEYCEGTKLLAHVDNDKVKKIDKFTPELLKPFDKVLVANVSKSAWYISNFGMILNNSTFECSNGAIWDCILPYNKETCMLLHHKDAEIPDFYKY